jgi:hypothetical protein
VFGSAPSCPLIQSVSGNNKSQFVNTQRGEGRGAAGRSLDAEFPRAALVDLAFLDITTDDQRDVHA